MFSTSTVKRSNQIKLKTHSFGFSKNFTEELTEFSKQHHLEDRFEFKQSWATWITRQDIHDKIESEIVRLKEDKDFKGTNADVYEKMFTSARYYYRKKIAKQKSMEKKEGNNEKKEENEEKKEENEEKKEEKLGHLTKCLTNAMDKHIKEYILKYSEKTNENNENSYIKSSADPARAYEDFCINHKPELRCEVEILLKKTNKLDIQELTLKFKKAYKNRFYKSLIYKAL